MVQSAESHEVSLGEAEIHTGLELCSPDLAPAPWLPLSCLQGFEEH